MSGGAFTAIAALVLLCNCVTIIICFRPSLRQTAYFLLTVLLIVLVISPLYQWWTYGPQLARVLPRGLVFLLSLFFLQRGKLPHKLFFVASLLTMTYLIPLWAAFIACRVVPADGAGYALWTLLLCVPLLGAYLALMIRYGYTLYSKLFMRDSARIWYLYAAYPIISLYVLSNLFEAIPPSYGWMRQYAGGAHLALTVFILSGFVLLCMAIITTHNKASIDYELRLSNNILDQGKGYYELLAARQEGLRVMRHDYRHHLGVLHGLLKTGESEVAESYLAELSRQYGDGDTPVYSGNPVVDALLGSVAARCAGAGIALHTAIALPGGMAIQNHALCIVLGNLLENALEACEALPEDQARFIRVDIKPVGTQLAIRVENAFDGVMRLDGERVLSRKKDGGLGLRSVQLIVDRLGGGYHVQWEGQVFDAYVLLNL